MLAGTVAGYSCAVAGVRSVGIARGVAISIDAGYGHCASSSQRSGRLMIVDSLVDELGGGRGGEAEGNGRRYELILLMYYIRNVTRVRTIYMIINRLMISPPL